MSNEDSDSDLNIEPDMDADPIQELLKSIERDEVDMNGSAKRDQAPSMPIEPIRLVKNVSRVTELSAELLDNTFDDKGRHRLLEQVDQSDEADFSIIEDDSNTSYLAPYSQGH